MLNRIAVVLGVVLFVAGCRTVEPPPPPEAPRVSSFTANKSRIAPGEDVTLTFATVGATKAEIVDDQGREVQLEGAVAEGTATVSPTRSAFYVLRATGPGGRDTAFVQIAVNEPLKDLFLLSVPAVIDSGEQAQLLWGAPGATTVTLKTGSGAPQALTGTTGTVTVSPITTEQYTLSAQGVPGTPALTALAQIEVRPVLKTATFEAATGVKPGETLRFTWTTAGAARISISERTFGQLEAVTDAAAVAAGSYDYVLPADLPNGVQVSEGLPLLFTVSASGGGSTVTRTFTAVVGDLPSIDLLEAPEAVTTGTSFTVRWRTTNATQVSILAGGLPLFTTLPTEQARVADGTVRLAGPTAATEYTLVATNDRGAVARQVFNVRPVAQPTIATFTLTPQTINALGDAVTARWTTTNAVRVLLRLENGATLAVVEAPSQVTSGNVSVTLATAASLTLEAYNAAGDVATLTRSVGFSGPSVFVTPNPVARGATATLQWTLAPGGVTEVVGLPASSPDAGVVQPIVTPTSRFVDLAALPAAEELTVTDAVNGVAQFTPPANFRFPYLGTLRTTLQVAVDGFIAFATPVPTGANTNFAASGNTAPSLLAPFWDDLVMGPNSKLYAALQTSSLGERFLVVQWEKVQIAGDANSELTFQVQLFETGQVTFIYKTLTGTLSSATVGVKETGANVVQVYNFNSATGAVTPDLELNFFAGHPADGTRTFTAQRSERIEFFGRTATGIVPVSAEVRSFGPGDVTVTETMPLPEASAVTAGQWIELRNNAAVPVDFDGLVISSSASSADGGYVIPAQTIVPAGGYLVLGQSTNTADTGGAPVTQVATDLLPLNVPDQVRVSLGGVTLGSLSWDAGVAGSSVQAIEKVLLASGATFNCPRTRTFGPNGAIGTPGAVNESCAPYVVEPIGSGFVNITSSGTRVTLVAAAADYDGVASVPLNQPFTYFGQQFSSVNVSVAGFLSFGPALAASNYVPNDTTPSTTVPNGVLAIFWDELVRNTNGGVYLRQDPDRVIISWDDFRIYATTSEMHFQVHLLSNGVIEFHYGSLSSTTTTQSTLDRLRASSASVWIEKPDGTLAVPWTVNTLGGISPNTSLRFTPVP
jgi:hypothetical protein